MAIIFMAFGLGAIGLTYFKPSFYWNARKATRLRNLIGDKATALVYYAIGAIVTVLGLLGQLNIISLS